MTEQAQEQEVKADQWSDESPIESKAIARAKSPSGSINAFSSESAFETGQRMAKALASSSLVPVAYQNNISNVLVAMEMATRIGASVFAVMQNMDIIHGRPSFRSSFLIATVNSCGRFTPLRYRFVGKEGTKDWGCRAYATDREDGEECVGTLITIGMAHAEGWISKKGSKWVTMPEQMLRYRAAAFWTRVYAPELSMGMHTADEVEDSSVITVHAEKPKRNGSLLAQKLLMPAEPVPVATEKPEYDEVTGEVPDGMAD